MEANQREVPDDYVEDVRFFVLESHICRSARKIAHLLIKKDRHRYLPGNIRFYPVIIK